MMAERRKAQEEGHCDDTRPYDFHELLSNDYQWMPSSKLALSLHVKTLENDGSPEGLCSREGDA
jgi:hypothetical protein